MSTYTVLLENGTVGTINDDTLDGQSAYSFIGERVNVHLHDENGNSIEKTGILSEVLEGDKPENKLILNGTIAVFSGMTGMDEVVFEEEAHGLGGDQEERLNEALSVWGLFEDETEIEIIT